MSIPAPTPSAKKQDWSASQYLKFHTERTRPVYDLISQIHPLITTPNPRIYDLGCGPGNSTKALIDAFPGARVTGMDSSQDMLEKARLSLPDVEFTQGDVGNFTPTGGDEEGGKGVDVLFSNAVFHWLRSSVRLPTLTRLLQSLPKGGVLAFQVPDNYTQPSHALMRSTALLPGKPWSPYFQSANIGSLSSHTRPDLDPIESPSTIYNTLVPHASSVIIWRTEYLHVLDDAGKIVEWVKGTGLQPFLHRMPESGDSGDRGRGVREAFLKEYERRLEEVYTRLEDGRVLLGYPRLFVVAVRK
ncbi:S-adenosyl-L-methionine-dependent methyltransferase [Lindgomyces ingoldianus]|uniref:S-adenosyl-L-methionine-dependent methyltransferase n=1 Tax=Lindgomyces ingoldianus TaxID=673940 RepID=A0ACB6QDQ6_9PLEO|nr:S-adenosyl-L-methionine-dependent methyltransferase [Lindgomyces ingoldianus]KAF2465061.1 S-adenosyl-L-methionine-dependent methyltransferase [Lindgomyces ingoldianus]